MKESGEDFTWKFINFHFTVNKLFHTAAFIYIAYAYYISTHTYVCTYVLVFVNMYVDMLTAKRAHELINTPKLVSKQALTSQLTAVESGQWCYHDTVHIHMYTHKFTCMHDAQEYSYKILRALTKFRSPSELWQKQKITTKIVKTATQCDVQIIIVILYKDCGHVTMCIVVFSGVFVVDCISLHGARIKYRV